MTLIKIAFVIVLLFTFVSSQNKPTPLDAIGTVLPVLSPGPASPYRVFNDLMKQSYPFVPYQLFSWGSSGRCWSCVLSQINGLSHQYPSILPKFIWGVAQIPFFTGIDTQYIGQTFSLSFSGNGIVGVFQAGLFNKTFAGNNGDFILRSINQSLFVYIYQTDPTNPVTKINIYLSSLGLKPKTFHSNFIDYLKPFNLLRTCYWQGQNLYNAGPKLQIWNNRTTLSSSTQVSSTGVAYQHILELERVTGATIWSCIPETADNNYVIQQASLFASLRDQTKLLYLQFGHVYTTMNDFPDKITNPVFESFMSSYGKSFRSSVLFTINYKYIQYYINAVGMRKTPINFTYIDAIGCQNNFGALQISDVWNSTLDQIKSNITSKLFQYQITINKAYQLATANKTSFLTWSGGPYLMTPRYGYIWKNKTNSSFAVNATLQLNLANILNNLNTNDEWVGELYLQMIARLKSMGIKSIVFSWLVGGSFTTDRDQVPLVPFLNTTTPAYRALNDSFFLNRKTVLKTFGQVPSNPFVCTPSCVWGDCVRNTCQCYVGYSGSDCSIYTAPTSQNKLGVGLQGISYWTTQNPFVDFHREGSGWVYFFTNQGWNSGLANASQVLFDANGYPTYIPAGMQVGTLIARDVKTHYPMGNYTILYDGDGILTFGMFDVSTVKYDIGKCIVTVTPSTNGNNGLLIIIARTNPNNYIRNIRVIAPGFQDIWWSVKFNPLLLDKLMPYGTIRFMDWTSTNDQTDKNWVDRVKTTSRVYTDNGVAWQQTIDLCNLLGKNAWINIPHLATDDYITQLANLFLSKLQPHLKVYVEYSNQLWGAQFAGGQYCQTQGILLNYSSDPTQARFCYQAKRTNDISTIWRNIFNGTNRSRLQIVVNTQSVNADTTKRILACNNGYKGVDMVAVGPYASINLKDNMTFADVFKGMNQQLATISTQLSQHLAIVKSYNLTLGAYESGQGLVGSTTTQVNLQIGVQYVQQMQDFYISYLRMLFNNSMTLVNHYTDSCPDSKYGSWGIFQYIDLRWNASYKWLGIKDYLAEQNLSYIGLSYGSCNNNCNNNGICSFGKCICFNDFTGEDCSIGKYIDFVQCGYLCTFNQGVCNLAYTVDINRYFSCTCLPGYIGAYCAIAVCSSNCNYAGKCVKPETCSCFRGKMGNSCEIDCGCGGHGTCQNDTTCLCDAGFVFNSTSKKCQYDCYGNSSSLCIGPKILGCAQGCVGGTCVNGSCACWPGFQGSNCSTQVAVNYVNRYLGLNIGGLSYWSTQHLFKDYAKQGSQWVPLYKPGYFNGSIQYTWNTGDKYPTLPNGYPKSLAANQSLAKLVLRDIQLKYPSISQTNQYVLLYDGDGIINLGFDATATEVSAGRIKFTVKPSTVRDNGIYINLIDTNPKNPVQNIRVILARDQYNYDKDLLTQNFMKFINEFSTIRCMDILATNGNPTKQWSDTTKADADTQFNTSGISIQLLTKIVRRTGKDIWFNVPHLASDNYVNTLASYLKANISSLRTIYVQYSNQVWNQAFDQGKYAVQQAINLNLSNYHKFYALRSKQIFTIFSNVFGNQTKTRLKFVISFQAVSAWVADQILNGTGLVGLVDIVANAPYYDCDSIGNTINTGLYAALTPADVIARCNNSFSTLDQYLQIGLDISQKYNLSLSIYEGGTSISEYATIFSGQENAQATTNFIAANRAPEMYDIYKKLLNKYKAFNYSINAPLNIFSSIGTPSKYGSWGVLDYLDQVNQTPTHPKFQAIYDYNRGI